MRLPVPQPWRRTSQDEPDDVPDDPTLVEVEQPDGSSVWCQPEAVDHYRPEVWRSVP